MKSREVEWALLMRAARAGDAAAYDRCLRDMAKTLRPFVRRALSRTGRGDENTEDVAGAVAGLTAGALAAALYAINCTDDSPLFVAAWYSLALLTVTLIGAIVGRRALRW